MNITNHVVAAALLAVAAGAQAAPDERKTSAEQAPVSAGMRVYIDPDTGRFSDRPVTAEQQRAAEAGVEAGPLAPMVETRHPNGMVQVDLNGHFEMASRAHVGPDGKLTQVCNEAGHKELAPHVHASPSKSREEQ